MSLILFALFCALTLADVALTVYALTEFKWFTELHPVVRWVIARFGYAGLYGLAGVTVIAVGIIAFAFIADAWRTAFLGFAVVCKTMPVLSNLLTIHRQER